MGHIAHLSDLGPDSAVVIFKKEFPEEVIEFNNNFESKDYTETANNVHKIKHKISILGLKEGLELASNFENQLKKGDKLIFAAFGGGFTWGAIYLTWAYNPK